MDETKIDDAVQKCVAYASDGDGPIHIAAEFLLTLRSSGWPLEELAEVRSRALAELGKRFADARPK